MKSESKNRKIFNIIFFSLIVIIAFSNIWSKQLGILLKLRPNIKESSETQVHFIDVGQGDAVAIRFSNGKTMLVDSGVESHQSKLVNYLDNIVLKESKNIDYVILTHPDSDHSGNMDYIINNYDVGNFYRPIVYESSELKEPNITNTNYREVINALNNTNTKVSFNEDKLQIRDGDIVITWIMPQDIDNFISKDNTNNLSPILIIEDNGVKVMLTGDIGKEVEKTVIDEVSAELLDIDILKLAHHGSKYSNSYEFLKATSPRQVVGCLGENTYGHPANETMERLLQYDLEFNSDLFSTFLNTRDDGNIIVTLNSPESIDVEIIDNIDSYIFVGYWVYTIIAISAISVIIALPYIQIFHKRIRFIIRNKRHIKLKEKQKMQQNND